MSSDRPRNNFHRFDLVTHVTCKLCGHCVQSFICKHFPKQDGRLASIGI